MNEVFKKLAQGSLVVEIANANQEKEFRHICKKEVKNAIETEVKIMLPILQGRDGTTYKVVNGKKKRIYPLLYGFEMYKQSIYIGYDIGTEAEVYSDRLIISFKDFKRNYRRMGGI